MFGLYELHIVDFIYRLQVRELYVERITRFAPNSTKGGMNISHQNLKLKS